jgi:hypothetical protein
VSDHFGTTKAAEKSVWILSVAPKLRSSQSSSERLVHFGSSCSSSWLSRVRRLNGLSALNPI